MTRICGVGDNVVDRYLETGLMYPGGSAVNVAVHARRLGASAGYVGILGDDEAATHVLKSLLDEGVDVSRVRHEAHPNSFADVTLDPDGNRVFGEFVPPVGRLELDEDDLAYLRGSDWLHTGHSSFTLSEVPTLGSLAPVVFDFSYKSLEWAAPVLPHVTAAFFSRGEADDEQCVALIEEVRALGPGLVVVTRGARGSVVWREGDVVHLEPAAPAAPIDTLGAGDAYLAAMLCALAEHRGLDVAAAEAAAYAATVCEHFGAFGHPVPIHQPTEEATR
ncbi:PfkB family carbohydrate kinase [Nocardioides sp. NPDC092400]|uniref:PfkB family carbohydrate kinase n=1 Tax=Nocardioides sp. NPDC092400 TaxID=3155196 RepID=UPI0034437273